MGSFNVADYFRPRVCSALFVVREKGPCCAHLLGHSPLKRGGKDNMSYGTLKIMSEPLTTSFRCALSDPPHHLSLPLHLSFSSPSPPLARDTASHRPQRDRNIQQSTRRAAICFIPSSRPTAYADHGQKKNAVVQAEKLANKEGMFGGKNDPYCVVSLAGSTQSFKTQVKKEAGSSCLWEESTQVGKKPRKPFRAASPKKT